MHSIYAKYRYERRLCILYKSFWNFINIIMKHDCRDYIGKIWNQSESVCRSYEILIENVHLLKD